jgi:LysM repeat protein
VKTTTTAPVHPSARYYKLRAGETLSDVAVRFNTTVEQLLALNPRVKPTALIVGQRIRIR